MDYINDLHELCESLSAEIAEVNEKIRSAGKMSPGDLEVVDKLTHALKSIKATIAMMEDDGASYNDGYRYSNRMYSRTQRPGMTRTRGYSRAADLAQQLHDLMQDAPNEAIRRDMQRLAEKIEKA